MDLNLTDEQVQFRSMLRDFVEREIKPVAREWEHASRYPTEIVEKLKALGLFGMTIPRGYGGLEMDPLSYALVFEELSRGWMGIAGILGSHSLACAMIASFGTEPQRKRWLPELAAGVRRTGIALTEPSAGSDLQRITTHARRERDCYVVNGTKMWITNARHADPLPTLVKTDSTADPPRRGMSVLLVEAGTPGFSVSRDLGKLGYKGPETCEVVFDDARVPVDNLLGGKEGRGFKHVLFALGVGRINIAARSVGIAQAAYEAAVDYALQREAFGEKIANFQAIQIKLADMATQIQAARLLTWWAASRSASGERTDQESAMAKLFSSEVAISCALSSMRIHGAYGYSTEFDVERLYRDAPLMAIGEGTNDIMRMVIARNIFAGRNER